MLKQLILALLFLSGAALFGEIIHEQKWDTPFSGKEILLTKNRIGQIHTSVDHPDDSQGLMYFTEEAYREGKARAIGVSNFYPDRLVDLCQFVEIPPAVNQVETHVFQQQVKAHEIMLKYGVQHESWGPLAEGRNNIFSNEILASIGEKHGKSVAQVALRFLIQKGIVVIPKTTHRERMVQNLDVFNFRLTDGELAQIATLDRAESAFFSHYDPETVEFITGLGRK